MSHNYHVCESASNFDPPYCLSRQCYRGQWSIVPSPGEPEVIVGGLSIGWIWQFLRAARLPRRLFPPRQSTGRLPSSGGQGGAIVRTSRVATVTNSSSRRW